MHLAVPALEGSGFRVWTIDTISGRVDDWTDEAPQSNAPDVNHPDSAPRGSGSCLALAFCSPPNTVLAGFEDGHVKFVDLECPTTEVASTKVLSSAVMAIERNPANDELYCCGLDSKGIACLSFNSSSDTSAPELQNWMRPKSRKAMRGADCISVRPDGKAVAAGCWDCRVRVFSTKTRSQLASLQYHSSTIPSVAFTPYDWMLAAAARDSTISLFDAFAKHTHGAADALKGKLALLQGDQSVRRLDTGH